VFDTTVDVVSDVLTKITAFITILKLQSSSTIVNEQKCKKKLDLPQTARVY
jgi:hypothetical protein